LATGLEGSEQPINRSERPTARKESFFMFI
jgi:hypothetical protein